jgi:hypothetical protein
MLGVMRPPDMGNNGNFFKNYTTDGMEGSLTGGLEILKAVNEYETNLRIPIIVHTCTLGVS